MGNCRVSIDELDNDIKQQADTDAMEARKASGAIEEIALAEYHKQLEDPQLMWEALGPDAFKGPYPNSNTIFCTCQNRAAEKDFESEVKDAIKDQDWLTLGTLLGQQCRSYLLDPAREKAEENGVDYE